MKQAIISPNAPAALGPYCHATVSGSLIFISGTLGIDPATGKLKETIEEQAAQIMQNLETILAEVGANLQNALKATIFLTDLNNFAAVNKIYGDAFNGVYLLHRGEQAPRRRGGRDRADRRAAVKTPWSGPLPPVLFSTAPWWRLYWAWPRVSSCFATCKAQGPSGSCAFSPSGGFGAGIWAFSPSVPLPWPWSLAYCAAFFCPS